MIAKITKGRALKTAALYLLHGSANASPGRGKVLATNFAGGDVRAWSHEFAAFRKLKPNLARAVAHISLNLSPEERQVSDEEFVEIANRFKEGLGYGDDCPFLFVRHHDREHQHVHLLLSRIAATGQVVPETNDYRRAEKLAAALRVEFRLKGPSDKKKNEEENDNMELSNPSDAKTQAIEARLQSAAEDTDAKLSAVAEPDAPSIGPVGTPDIKTVRNWRREMLSDEYRRAVDDLFLDQLRYVRKSTKALTLYFRDGSRLYDTGDRITAYACPDHGVAAARLMEVAILRGWDQQGIALSGSDEFLRAAMLLAIQKNINVVPTGSHQIALLAEIRKSLASAQTPSLAPATGAMPSDVPNLETPKPPPVNPLSLLKGKRRIGQRLEERRQDVEDSGGLGTPPSVPGMPRRMGPR